MVWTILVRQAFLLFFPFSFFFPVRCTMGIPAEWVIISSCVNKSSEKMTRNCLDVVFWLSKNQFWICKGGVFYCLQRTSNYTVGKKSLWGMEEEQPWNISVNHIFFRSFLLRRALQMKILPFLKKCRTWCHVWIILVSSPTGKPHGLN